MRQTACLNKPAGWMETIGSRVRSLAYSSCAIQYRPLQKQQISGIQLTVSVDIAQYRLERGWLERSGYQTGQHDKITKID